MGAGWTGFFASGKGKCSANSKTAKSAWVYVLDSSSPMIDSFLKTPSTWNLVLKTNGDSTFGFSSSYWTDAKLLNEGADVGTPGNAKYDAFNTLAFKKVKMCIGGAHSHCIEHTLTKSYWNARALFSAGYIKDRTFSKQDFLAAMGPAQGSYRNCGMQRPGFNIECKDGNKARWGFCNNCASQNCQTSDSNDADAAIGLGLNGQKSPEMGAGWTNFFASGEGSCKADSMTAKNAWFYVFNEAEDQATNFCEEFCPKKDVACCIKEDGKTNNYNKGSQTKKRYNRSLDKCVAKKRIWCRQSKKVEKKGSVKFTDFKKNGVAFPCNKETCSA